eukprot:6196934-Pleurochrysis_carterae.AAC.2
MRSKNGREGHYVTSVAATTDLMHIRHGILAALVPRLASLYNCPRLFMSNGIGQYLSPWSAVIQPQSSFSKVMSNKDYKIAHTDYTVVSSFVELIRN